MAYDNTNKGAVWGNSKKEKDTHPDFKGELNVEGVEYWVSAWRRGEGANQNAPALKFAITKKEPVSGQDQEKKVDFDDDVPS